MSEWIDDVLYAVAKYLRNDPTGKGKPSSVYFADRGMMDDIPLAFPYI